MKLLLDSTIFLDKTRNNYDKFMSLKRKTN